MFPAFYPQPSANWQVSDSSNATKAKRPILKLQTTNLATTRPRSAKRPNSSSRKSIKGEVRGTKKSKGGPLYIQVGVYQFDRSHLD